MIPSLFSYLNKLWSHDMKRINSQSQLLYYYYNNNNNNSSATTTTTTTTNPTTNTANPITNPTTNPITTLYLSSSITSTNIIMKKSRTNEFINKLPSNYIPINHALIIPSNILQLLQSLQSFQSLTFFKNNYYDGDDDNNNNCYFQFIFFLGAQGKEFIPTIKNQFPFNNNNNNNISIIFITSNYTSSDSVGCTNDQCKQLMEFFKIKDPMGGGLYPLDYLIIIHENKVHCKLPIKFNTNINTINNTNSIINNHFNHFKIRKMISGLYFKFAINLNELPLLIDEYINYTPKKEKEKEKEKHQY